MVYAEQSPDRLDSDVVSVDVDGADRTTIISGPTNDFAPAVSPDGTLLAFVRSSGASISDCCGNHTAEIWVLRLADRAVWRIGTDVGDWGVLTWSPDGRYVVAMPLASDGLIVLPFDPRSEPVRSPSPNNVGVVSWQALQ